MSGPIDPIWTATIDLRPGKSPQDVAITEADGQRVTWARWSDGWRLTSEWNETERGAIIEAWAMSMRPVATRALCDVLSALGSDGSHYQKGTTVENLTDAILSWVKDEETRAAANEREHAHKAILLALDMIDGDVGGAEEVLREEIRRAKCNGHHAPCRPATFTVPTEPTPAGVYHNCVDPCGVDGCKGGLRVGGVVLMGKP